MGRRVSEDGLWGFMDLEIDVQSTRVVTLIRVILEVLQGPKYLIPWE